MTIVSTSGTEWGEETAESRHEWSERKTCALDAENSCTVDLTQARTQDLKHERFATLVLPSRSVG